MKILMLNTLYHPYQVGGAERSTRLLAEALAEAGHGVAVACTAPESGPTTKTVNGVKVHYVGLRNVYWPFGDTGRPTWLKPLWHALDSYNPFMRTKVEALIVSESPDLVHTHNLGGFSVSAWQAARQASLPIVHTMRDYSLLCPRNMFQNGENCGVQCLQCRPFAAPRRRLSRHVTAAVGVSRFVLERHRAHGYFSETNLQTVIHNPFPVSVKGTPGERPSEKTPEKETSGSATLESGAPVRVGFLGRLSKMKGIEVLLRTARHFTEDQLQFHVAGRGEENFVSALKTAHDRPNVTFCGFVDPEEFLSGLDLLVVPSVWHEPFGRVVVEAYAHGVPVVASRRGGLSEIVDDGETGWIFQPNREGALRELLEHVCENPGQLADMRRRAREKALSFGLATHVEAYTRVYQKAKELD